MNKTAPPKKRPAAPQVKVSAAKASAAKSVAKPAAAKPAAAKPVAAKKPEPRADYGAPVEGFFAKQPPPLRAILEQLRTMIGQAAPDTTSSIKWGMPFYTIGDGLMCALAGFKAHVNLILPGPPGTYADPDGLLEGDGKTGRHLKIRSLEDLPKTAVRGWLRTAAALARKQN
jgi:hypothetical protein